jgi:hypothetical protein
MFTSTKRMNFSLSRLALKATPLVFFLLTGGLDTPESGAQTDAALERFALDGRKNIMAEENFGIVNGKITTRVHHRSVGVISGLFAPPYASSDFLLETRLFGEIVPASDYRWYPFEVRQSGQLNGVSVESTILLPTGQRSGLLAFTFHNQTGQAVDMPIQFHIRGGLNYVEKWEFARPKAEDLTINTVEQNRMIRANGAGKLLVLSDIPELDWFELGSRWDARIELAPGQKISYHLALETGDTNVSGANAEKTLADPAGTIARTREAHADEVRRLFERLPRFSASDKRLEHYYYRSLVTLFTNKWQVPEFVLQPYYGSGGVIGGCVGNYLWEFGLPSQLFPLCDPEASAAHIKQFLQIDITRHFLFNPLTGKGGGVWYQVNQDKIVEAIYYYVLHTGHVDFLSEKVAGKTIYEHFMENALFGDDLTAEVKLVDYGKDGENHLELRRGYPYQGVMPDVNALRYLTYVRAYQISRIMGQPLDKLLERAESLKSLLKRELWSPEHAWFYFRYDGKKDIRWTNFMYTLIGTGVFDQDVEKGLLSHLNEREFLGEYGIHSISKLDPAYDQVDIDHGGGGSYMAFPPLICQRLYNAGFRQAADDLLRRHLWWGERLPYWGDSKVANYMGYRQDTPLQSDFDSITGAQTFIFGLFGIRVEWNGEVIVNPAVPAFSSEIRLEGLKLRGKNLTIEANPTSYTVTVDGKMYTGQTGTPLVVQ